jgi:RNA-directed DNA polymerase
LVDIEPKSLDELPFVLEPGQRFATSARTITVSTDGCIATQGRRRGKDQGPGGWAFVVHETGEEGSGRVASGTNNQMELRAVIEAIKSTDPRKSIIIRTDSQYVCNAIKIQATIKTNNAMWREYEELTKDRRIKVIWIKGHFGDKYNERADRLAGEEANAGAKGIRRFLTGGPN